MGAAPVIWLIAKLITLLEVRKAKCEPGNATTTLIGNLIRTKGNEALVWAALGLPVFSVAWAHLSDRQSKESGCQEEGLCGESATFGTCWKRSLGQAFC